MPRLHPGEVGAIVHRHDQTADCPEQAILVTAYVPQPLALGDFPNRDGRDEKVNEAKHACNERIDCEDKSDRDENFDDAGERRISRRCAG
jgi:hypothetical protein